MLPGGAGRQGLCAGWRGCVRGGERLCAGWRGGDVCRLEVLCAGWRGAVERRGDLGDGPVEQHAQGHGCAVGQREGGEVRPHCQVGPALAADVEAEVEARAARTAAEDRLRNTCTCTCHVSMCMCTCMCMCTHTYAYAHVHVHTKPKALPAEWAEKVAVMSSCRPRGGSRSTPADSPDCS